MNYLHVSQSLAKGEKKTSPELQGKNQQGWVPVFTGARGPPSTKNDSQKKASSSCACDRSQWKIQTVPKRRNLRGGDLLGGGGGCARSLGTKIGLPHQHVNKRSERRWRGGEPP